MRTQVGERPVQTGKKVVRRLQQSRASMPTVVYTHQMRSSVRCGTSISNELCVHFSERTSKWNSEDEGCSRLKSSIILTSLIINNSVKPFLALAGAQAEPCVQHC